MDDKLACRTLSCYSSCFMKKRWLNSRFDYLIANTTQKMQYLLSCMFEVEKLANELNPLTLKEKLKYLQISLNEFSIKKFMSHGLCVILGKTSNYT